MATNSWGYVSRDAAIDDLTQQNTERARVWLAMLALSAVQSHSSDAPVVVSVTELPRPDGGVAVQYLVQQHAPQPQLDTIDTTTSAPPAPATPAAPAASETPPA